LPACCGGSEFQRRGQTSPVFAGDHNRPRHQMGSEKVPQSRCSCRRRICFAAMQQHRATAFRRAPWRAGPCARVLDLLRPRSKRSHRGADQ
jgi:hypothetical protein